MRVHTSPRNMTIFKEEFLNKVSELTINNLDTAKEITLYFDENINQSNTTSFFKVNNLNKKIYTYLKSKGFFTGYYVKDTGLYITMPYEYFINRTIIKNLLK